MSKNINDEKLIYFCSPNGTWVQINKNLKALGLDTNKVVKNTYLRYFINSVINDDYLDMYKNIDVLVIDEFYENIIENNIGYEKCFEVFNQLTKQGKQIVMAGHNQLKEFYNMPSEFMSLISNYDLRYDLKVNLDYEVEYI